MQKNRQLVGLSLVLVLALVVPMTTTASQPAAPSPTGSVRVIVELADAALAAYEGGVAGLRATAARGVKLDMASPTAQAYLDYLGERHTEFTQTLAKTLPEAIVAHFVTEDGISRALDYRVTFNGMAINLPAFDKATALALLKMPGVKAVYPEREYQINLDVSNDYMGAPDMWAAAGGQANAGAGIKVAVLDTGIDEEHSFFDPTGFSYPPGYPKGDTNYTTEKVIVARGYYRPDDPPANPGPTDYDSHGTGTAGIVGGNMGTTSVISNTFSEITKTVSGVAPAAQLMNYQIFYTAQSGTQSAWNPEILAAIEDMVADGADVSNNSWGGVDNLVTTVDPIGIAFSNAVAAGVTVAKSAGNSGPFYNSLGDVMPQELIIAGGTDMGRRVSASASVLGPGTVPVTLTNMLAVESDFGGPPLTGILSGNYVYVGRAGLDPANFDGCAPFNVSASAAISGNIALISRGSCNFTDKVQNAQDAGATGTIVFNHNVGGLPTVMGGGSSTIVIPSVMVGNQNGLDMVAWDAANPGTAEAKVDPALAYILDAAPPDTMYQSSSRGPDLMQEIGVDVLAPGDSVWTSYSTDGGWSTVGGTSFSGPFAAGAAAVMKGLYPGWEPWAIKSAMMSTAQNKGIYKDYAHTMPAGVLDMGAGRLQFDHMVDPGLVFDTSSLSYKQMMAGTSKTMTVMATDVFSRTAGTDFTYTLAISETGDITTTANFTLSVSPAALTFSDDGDMASFDVTMEVPAGAEPGDYEGWVWLRHGPHELHLPVWVRVRPEVMENHVLILDDDASPYGIFADYLSTYTDALDAVGYTYDVWDTALAAHFTGRGLPTIAEMQAYDKIVWFTGDSYYTYYEIGAELQSRNDLLDVLQSGGAKVLATGMDLTGYEISGNASDQYLFWVGMAAEPLVEDAYGPAFSFAPNPAVEGTGAIAAFDGMAFDLGAPVVSGTITIGDGAGNQGWVDELVPYSNSDLYGGRGFLRSLEPGSQGEGWVGVVRSMEPTLENDGVLPGPDYRTMYLSFGLEGINNDTGYNTREELMMHGLNFLQDDLQATLTISGTQDENGLATFSVEAEQLFTGTLRLPALIDQVRWDFGDGSPFYGSDAAAIQRQYANKGVYRIRAEVIDQYGHAVLLRGEVEIGHVLFLPIITTNSP